MKKILNKKKVKFKYSQWIVLVMNNYAFLNKKWSTLILITIESAIELGIFTLILAFNALSYATSI